MFKKVKAPSSSPSPDITEHKPAKKAPGKALDELEMRVEERTAQLTKANEELRIEIAVRKLAKDALRESEEFSSSLLTNSPNAILVTNPDTSVRYVNPTLEKLAGFTSTEITGRKAPYPWWTEETLQKISRDFEEALDKGAERAEQCFQKKNGERFWVEVTATPVRHGGEFKYFLANWVDITKRKLAEEALRESEERFRDLFENANDLIQSVMPDGHFLYTNRAWQKVLGYSEEELANLTLWDIIHPDSIPHCREVFQKVMSGEAVNNIEVIFVAKDGRLVAVEGNANCRFEGGKPVAARGIFRDITERKEVEQELEIQRAHFKSIFDYSLEGIVTLDVNNNILDANLGFENIYGYKLEEVKEKRLDDLIVPERFYNTEAKELNQIALDGILGYETIRKRKDGTELNVSISAGPIKIGGEPRGLFVIFRDITARKRAEEALQESEERYRALVNLGAEVGEAITMAQDTEQGEAIHIFVNDEWPRITGYSREELLGMSFLDLVHPEHREASLKRHRSKMSGEAIPGPFEMTIIRKDGTEVPIEFTGAYTMYKGKHADVVYIRDITERKKTEEALISFNKLAVDRELRMIELKKEINTILQKLGEEPRYKIAEENKTKLNK